MLEKASILIKRGKQCNKKCGEAPFIRGNTAPPGGRNSRTQVELVSSVRVDTTKTIEVESTKMDEETDDLEASCCFPSHKESQSLLLHLDSKPATMHQQEEELVLDPSMLVSVHPVDPKLINKLLQCVFQRTQQANQKARADQHF